MPVWLISVGLPAVREGVEHLAGRAGVDPDGVGAPGAPRPRRTAQDRRVRRRLEREPDACRSAGPVSAPWSARTVLGRAREVVDEQRRAVLAGERLEVGAVDAAGGRRRRRAGPAPPAWGPAPRRARTSVVTRGRRRGRDRGGRPGDAWRPAGRAARIARRVTGSANGSGPSATSVPIAWRSRSVAWAISSTASSNASALRADGRAEATDLADVLEGGGLGLAGRGGPGSSDRGAGGCFGTCREGYRAGVEIDG